jgi:PPOX class probable FMN-dependent enzyme
MSRQGGRMANDSLFVHIWTRARFARVMPTYEANNVLTSFAEVKASIGEDHPTQTNEVIDHIDAHCRAWIEKSPFIVVSSANAAGAMDVSPKGDPPCFVRVLDQKTLAIPDRLGNHRGDTFKNLLEKPRVGILFVIPKRTEVVRVSGSAQIVVDPDLLADMAVNDKRPQLAILVRVEEAMFHCGKSMVRSRMWRPDEWGPIDGLPSYAQALKDHGKLPDPLADLEQLVANNEAHRLY